MRAEAVSEAKRFECQRSYFMPGFEEGASAYFYTRDKLGSIWEVVQDDGATIEERMRYRPWGELQVMSGSGLRPRISALQATTRIRPMPCSLPHIVHTHPTERGDSCRDPLGYRGGGNLYSYVDNEPTGLIDSDGRQLLDPPWPGPLSPPPPVLPPLLPPGPNPRIDLDSMCHAIVVMNSYECKLDADGISYGSPGAPPDCASSDGSRIYSGQTCVGDKMACIYCDQMCER